MRLHVSSDHRYRWHLSVVYCSLTLIEDYNWSKLSRVNSYLLNLNLAVLALVQLILKILDSLLAILDSLVLISDLSLLLVQLSVKVVDLSLIVKLSICEVVSTVWVLELVSDTSVQTKKSIVQVEVRLCLTNIELLSSSCTVRVQSWASCLSRSQSPSNLWVDVNLQSRSNIDIEWKTSLSNDLELTWLTFVTCEQVVKVYVVHQSNIQLINNSSAVCKTEDSVTLYAQTINWSDVATDSKTCLTVKIVKYLVVMCWSNNATIHTYIPIVWQLALWKSLCLCISSECWCTCNHH